MMRRGALILLLAAGCSRAGFENVEILRGEETWYDLGDSDMGSRIERIGGSSWGGGISNSSGGSGSPSLALDAAGNPVVAWDDTTSGDSDIYVRRFDGARWVELGAGSATDGGISDNGGHSDHPALALDSLGHPVVTWFDSSSNHGETYVKRFDGAIWVDAGLSSSSGGGVSGGESSGPDVSLARDGGDNLILSWPDRRSGVYQIYVLRFDGAAWAELGTGSASGGGISNTSGSSYETTLALDSSGYPVVAWRDDTSGNYEIYVRRFNGTSWMEVGASSAAAGGISDNGGASIEPSLSLESSGNPVVAWSDNTSGNYEIYVRRFNGTSWVEVGTSSAADGGISNNSGWSRRPSLGLDGSDHPVVAWDDDTSGFARYEIYVRRFDGTSWVDVGTSSAAAGGISDNVGASGAPSLALDDSGRPTVAWEDSSPGGSEIFVRRFDGASWVDFGVAPARGGISNNDGYSRESSLVMDTLGNPVVAWQDFTGDNFEIYVRRFDGTAWIDVSLGSSSAGGMSPTVALVALDGPVVTWESASQIHVARFDGASWIEEPRPFALNAHDARVVVDAAGRLIVVASVYQTGINYEIYAARLDGGVWTEIGAGSSSGGGISNNAGWSRNPSVAVDFTGNPVVAWSDDTSGDAKIYVLRFNGTSWAEVGTSSATGGGISSNTGSSISQVSPGIAVDASGNPVVAWHAATSGSDEIYVARFDGASWGPVGLSGASGGGISNNGGWSSSPTIAVDASGNPIVAWQDTTPGDYEIYVKRFDGVAWQEMDGSASSGGISNSGGPSTEPSLAVAAGRACVSWTEGGAASTEIVMRCATLP